MLSKNHFKTHSLMLREAQQTPLEPYSQPFTSRSCESVVRTTTKAYAEWQN